MTDITAAQLAAMQAVLDAARPAGGGQTSIEAGVLTNFARAEPELAAAACQAFLQLAQTSKGYGGGMAVALAAAYQSVFDDDTLSVLVGDHYAALGQQVPALRLQSPEAGPAEVPASAEPVSAEPAAATAPVHYEVPQDALEDCDIYPLLRVFSHRHLAEGESGDRLRNLGGKLYMTFPIPVSDPRHVWEVPSVRAYIRALADAMPYLPYYLAPDPELGMFAVYFGSLADPSMFTDGGLDLMNEQVFVLVASALVTAAQFASAVGADWQASARALLAVVSPEAVDFMMDSLHEMLRELEQELPGQ